MVLDAANNDYSGQLASRPVVRKKFAKPPVKVACLPCRASRTRCGGQQPCTNCVTKGRRCSYLPSKRGGPRKKKTKTSPPPEEDALEDDSQVPAVPATPGFDEPSGMFSQIDVLSLPGAGLRHLDFSSEVPSMFQGYYNADGSQTQVPMESVPSPLSNTSHCLMRTYASEADILNAYYDFIHYYFPILPPRASPPCPDRPLHCPASYPNSPSEEPFMIYRPLSPLSLAVSAILALIPHPNDPDPSLTTSVTHRRTYAHAFAKLANADIEADCDFDVSSTDPGQALSDGSPRVRRDRFHPRTPADLESLLALLVLSVYEYSQRGNMLKMRYRAGQALSIALDKSLHGQGAEQDEFSEARRRAWWMTYYCVIQGSIVSTTPAAIVINDPQFTTPYPRFAPDAEGWSILIQAQQVLVSATQFVADLNKCLSSRTDMHYLFERMQQLDVWTSSVLAQTELLPIISQETDLGDHHETVTAQSIRAISRIKLSSAQIKTHRFRAFSDIPIFIKRHCDLTAANNTDTNATTKPAMPESGINSISCSCSSLEPFHRSSSTEYLNPSDSSASSEVHMCIPQYPFTSGFPYSCQHSAKVCVNAALVISRTFQILPFPQPLLDSPERQEEEEGKGRTWPRTMPSFACCLMQSSYAMFMIFYKARVAKQLLSSSALPDGDDLEQQQQQQQQKQQQQQQSDSTDQLVEDLKQGLQRVLATVSNYALAFEALAGMKDEIQGAYQTAFLPS